MKFFSQKEQDCFNWFNSYLKKVELPTKKDLLAEFERFDLGDKLHIIEGFIEDTSDQYTRDKISLLHIDVDFYYPTLHTLISFYDKVSSGGMIIIDDYNLQQTDCKTAVNNFRLQRNITSPIQTLGNYQVAWIKE